jgi:hypothetical protein
LRGAEVNGRQHELRREHGFNAKSGLDELLTSEAFTGQSNYSAVDVAQCILHLAAKGESDAKIRRRRRFVVERRCGLSDMR